MIQIIAVLFAALAPISLTHAHEIAFERDSRLPVVYINIAVKAGSAADPQGQEGLSNFMGRMLLKGTTSKTKEQIDLEIDKLGSALGAETRVESFILRGAVISSQLKPFLALAKEILTSPSFPESEIQKLKAMVTSEILEDLGNDSSLGRRHFIKSLFGNHPYGRSLDGTIPSVKNISRASLIAQHKNMIQGRELLIVGTGDADESTIRNWAESFSVDRSKAPLAEVAPANVPTKRKLTLVDKPDRTQTWIFAGQKGVKMTDPLYFPLYIANHAFGGGSFSSRLMVEIRVKRGWSYGAGSNFRFGTQARSWGMSLFPASLYTHLALGHTLKMVEELRDKGITQEEFDFAKQSLINNSGFGYNTPGKRVENILLERTLNLPSGFIKNSEKEISRISIDQVNSSLKQFLSPEDLQIVVLCTAKDLKEKLITAAGVKPAQVQVVDYRQD